jgi:hypothetical protein
MLAYRLTPWNRDLVEKIRTVHLVKRITHPLYMEPNISKRPPLDPILSQANPVHILTAYFFTIHFNSIVPYTYIYPKWSLPFGFSD